MIRAPYRLTAALLADISGHVRITLAAPHSLSLDLGSAWVVDASEPDTREQLGIYVRSITHGIYMNVRGEVARSPAMTRDDLTSLLREQNWASKPFDEWTTEANGLAIVGGTFETVGMNGEVVMEVFVSDGTRIANLAGPAARAVATAVTPALQTLAKTIVFG